MTEKSEEERPERKRPFLRFVMNRRRNLKIEKNCNHEEASDFFFASGVPFLNNFSLFGEKISNLSCPNQANELRTFEKGSQQK